MATAPRLMSSTLIYLGLSALLGVVAGVFYALVRRMANCTTGQKLLVYAVGMMPLLAIAAMIGSVRRLAEMMEVYKFLAAALVGVCGVGSALICAHFLRKKDKGK